MARLQKYKGVGYRLSWRGNDLAKDCVDAANEVHALLLLEAEQRSKNYLYPGNGVKTGTMKRGIHVAEPGFDWDKEDIPPSENTPERGGKLVMPKLKNRKWGLELGVGVYYSIFYHEIHYPFLRVPWELAMKDFKELVDEEWRVVVG